MSKHEICLSTKLHTFREFAMHELAFNDRFSMKVKVIGYNRILHK